MDIKTNIDIAETTKAFANGFINKETAPYFFAITTILIVLVSYIIFGALFLYKLDNILIQMERTNQNATALHEAVTYNQNEIKDLRISQKELEIIQKDHEKRILKVEYRKY